MENPENPAKGASDSVHVIACGVLAVDLRNAAARLGIDLVLHALPGGLHATPNELRCRLQEAIDDLSDRPAVSRIVIGYGVCGRGAVGLQARGVPLVIPRVHDCIALFLGSDARYQREFAGHPGTYYLSAGWVEERERGRSDRPMGSDHRGETQALEARASLPTDREMQALASQYGDDNARHIRFFYDSWKRNYTRAAYIDTGVGAKTARIARLAQTMADENGWEYARLEGTHDLLRQTLTAETTTDAVLIVPPGAGTVYDALRRRLEATVASTVTAADPTGSAATASSTVSAPERRGIGLGIDAGGTYTDAVVYDFEDGRILGKAKALTTRWDYRQGIREALSGLDAELLARVDLTAVSTTLATNAIVEGRGQATGLLVMPPYGWRDVTGFRHSPMALIDGQLEIDGVELQAVNPDQIREVARRMIERHDVAAFAVGGYASHANPAHELAVKAVISEATGLSVTCSHELSEGLDYRVRAETAALNARIIPCLREFLDHLPETLADFAIHAPVMIVRSDGSLMNFHVALERPLETMLSGPAASAAGAAWLAQRRDALIVDIGGTTSDSAVIRDGVVKMCDAGAVIGGWQTHIRALDLRTTGLGGDSHIRWADGRFRIGPQRVTPIARLAAQCPAAAAALDGIEQAMARYMLSGDEIVVLATGGGRPLRPLTADEQRVMECLADRPMCLRELTESFGKMHFSLLPLARLEAWQMVQRCALTPTDLLHAAGRIALWDQSAAGRICAINAALAGWTPAGLIDTLTAQVERTLAGELLAKQLAEDIPSLDAPTQSAARQLIDRALDGSGNGYRVRIELDYPVIGIGAPAACFAPAAAERLGARALVPEHADVANAVGAVIGSVAFRRRVNVAVNELGWYRLRGVPDAPTFQDLDEATAHGTAWLRQHLTDLAQQAGCQDVYVDIVTLDSQADTSDGSQVFVGRTLEGRVSGPPKSLGEPIDVSLA